MSTLFKKDNVLTEDVSVLKLTPRQNSEKLRIKEKITSWVSNDEKHITALIGPSGSGKSSVLEKIRHETEQEYIWLNFDVWSYSDREQIWDGFILEAIYTGSERSKKTKKSKYAELAIQSSKMEGLNWIARKIQDHTYIACISLIAIIVILSLLFWNGSLYNDTTPDAYLKAFLKYAVPPSFLALAFIGVTNLFPQRHPMQRTFEYEGKLINYLHKLTKPLIIVIEDVDRATDEGLIFMETLHNFLKNADNHIANAVIVIAPQDTKYFNVVDQMDPINSFERTLKIYDSSIYYSATTPETDDALQILHSAQPKPKYAKDLEDIIAKMFNDYRDRISLRLYKYILREVSAFIETNPSASAAIAFCLITSRYITVENSSSHGTSISASKNFLPGQLTEQNDIGWPFVKFMKYMTTFETYSNESTQRIFTIRYIQQPESLHITPQINAKGVYTGDMISFDEIYKVLV